MQRLYLKVKYNNRIQAYIMIVCMVVLELVALITGAMNIGDTNQLMSCAGCAGQF